MKRVELVLTTLLTLAAVTVAGVAVSREFGSPRTRQVAQELQSFEISRNDWQQLVAVSRRLGAPSDSLTIVVLSDFECPSCRAFHRIVGEVSDSLRDSIDIRYAHLPLPYHRFALPSARMVECLADDADARRLIDLFFENQDSLGLLSWVDYARQARAPEPEAIAGCASVIGDGTRFSRIDSGLVLAERIGAQGTPTVVIQGKRYSGVPTTSQLLRLIRSER